MRATMCALCLPLQVHPELRKLLNVCRGREENLETLLGFELSSTVPLDVSVT